MSTAADRGQHISETTIPANRQRPPLDWRQATRPVLVIARIVWHDREEWWPARATGWSDSLVNVTWHDERGHYRDEWIPVEDVKRVIVTPLP